MSKSPPNTASALEAMLDLRHPVKMAAAEFAAAELARPAGGIDEFDRPRWKAAAEFGIQGMMVPEQYGGGGRSAVEGALTFEGLGFGSADNGFVFALAAQSFAMQRALLAAGTEAQKSRWLPALAQGGAIGCFAMSEPGAGSDTGSIATTAAPLGDDEYEISGEKAWVTLAPVADVIVVFATTDRERGHWGISAYLVETDRAGIEVGPTEPKMGLNTCPFAAVRFERCRVGPDDRLGPSGAGGSVFTGAVEAERAFLYAAQLGAVERIMEYSVLRARTRTAYGQPIGGFQAISHKLANMKLHHESARLLVLKAAELYDRGDPMTMAGALAKLQTSEMAVAASLDALRIHGAEGYTVRAGVEADVRDALGGLAYSGTSEIARNLVARLLRVDRPMRGGPSS